MTHSETYAGEAHPDVSNHTPPTNTGGPAHHADPAPVGLAAFAMTTFVLSVVNTNMLDRDVASVVLPLALFYGGVVQLLAGMWEFRAGNTFGALAFSSFGAFWLAYWGLGEFFKPGAGVTQDTVNNALGVFLLAWTIFTLYMTVAAVRVNGAVLGVFVFLTLTFFFLMLGAFGNSDGLTKFGGWLGLITAVIAWYASFAGVVNSTWRRTVLPLGAAKH